MNSENTWNKTTKIMLMIRSKFASINSETKASSHSQLLCLCGLSDIPSREGKVSLEGGEF